MNVITLIVFNATARLGSTYSGATSCKTHSAWNCFSIRMLAAQAQSNQSSPLHKWKIRLSISPVLKVALVFWTTCFFHLCNPLHELCLPSHYSYSKTYLLYRVPLNHLNKSIISNVCTIWKNKTNNVVKQGPLHKVKVHKVNVFV